jgi:2-phospho-L-lactate guanylyltransferase
MSTLAILPIKTFSEAKQRLAAELTAGPRRALAEAMFSDVLTALRRASLVDAILVVTADHGAQQIAGGHGATVLDDTSDGHNPAASLGIAYALERGHERALLVPGDCPLLSAAALDGLLSAASGDVARSAVIVPDRHGTGTNALVLRPPDALPPSFGPGSCERHLATAREAGTVADVLEVAELALDVDTPDDLLALQETLARTHGGAAHTRGMLSQLMRSRV